MLNRKLFISIAVSAMSGTAIFAQHPLTLEDAMRPYMVIPVRYPSNTWAENGMPYEEAKEHTASADHHDQLNSTGTFALDFVNWQKVWRYETRGDYELVNLTTGEKRRLGKGLPATYLMFAKFSPDGTKVAYVCKNNIYVEDVASEGVRPLTTSGNDSIVNGTFDWVYEEEFDCRDGFRWSGDSKYIAYWQSDTSGTGWFDIINNVDSIYPTVQHFPYPKAGTRNSAVRIGVLDVNAASTTWLDIPGDQRENYLPRMEFVPGTNRLMIQQMNRAQNHNTVWTATLTNGSPLGLKVMLEDSDSAWVETNDNIHFLQGNKYFTFTSERDGYRHIYRVSADGRKWNCITRADMDVVEEVALDEKHGYIYYIGVEPDRATERYLYRSKLFGNGKVEKVACQDAAGQYSYDMSPTCDYAVQCYSSASTAPQFHMMKMDKSGRWTVTDELELNAEATAKFNDMFCAKEFVKVRSGNLMLDAWIIKPKDFDPSRKYPVIDYVYGEPASATVQNRWENSLFWQYLANQGYIVVSIENRGANSPRGREWRKCIYGEVGVAASDDQARGIMDLCRQFEYMDSTRLGITGWSGGGSQTLNCMFRYPDVFRTGVAIAFVSDQRLYDTIYQERYMNTPQANKDGYFRGSPINFTEGLKGNLLLIHGTGDDNVHYQNCEMLANRLISQGKIFYQLSYPMRTHSISEGIGTSLHLRQTIIDFFDKNL